MVRRSAEIERLIDQKRAADGLPPRYSSARRQDALDWPQAAQIARMGHHIIIPQPPPESAPQEAPGEPDSAPGEQLVKVYPELARLAVALRLDGPLMLWLILRHLDVDGRGYFESIDAALDAALALWPGRKSKRTLRRYFWAGLDLFWSIYGERLRLHGLFRSVSFLMRLAGDAAPDILTARQETASPAGVPARLPLAAFASLGEFRAAVFAAWIGQREGGLTATAGTLARLWGRSISTIWEWASKAGVSTRRNYATTRPPEPGSPYNAQLPDFVLIRNFERVFECSGALVWQIASTFHAVSNPTRPGMARGLSKRMAGRGRRCGLPAVEIGDGHRHKASAPRRLYFETVKAYRKWLRRANKPGGPRCEPEESLPGYVRRTPLRPTMRNAGTFMFVPDYNRPGFRAA